ncbi:MAG: YlxR family protein, partial [Oscillospiraceae bacterium]|nr:YlxR family protein [Oscillospiraceae bacterium]
RKIPQRKCVGCGTSKDKKELIRVVKNSEGEISVDLTGKKNGRGAYICHDAECLKKAKKAGRLEKSFECQISEEIYERLMQEITADE